jgi:acylphosphatase
MRVVRIAVRGRVQGVGFRDWVMRRAGALELAGWVRNRSDGSVEIFAAGEAQAVQRLVEAARGGPPFSRVAELEVEDTQGEVPAGFERRPTL